MSISLLINSKHIECQKETAGSFETGLTMLPLINTAPSSERNGVNEKFGTIGTVSPNGACCADSAQGTKIA